MGYRSYWPKGTSVKAVLWHRNGDHPEDHSVPITDNKTGENFLSEGLVVRRFSHPDIPGETFCARCGRRMCDHGWIDRPLSIGVVVYPDSYVCCQEDGHYFCTDKRSFEENFLPSPSAEAQEVLEQLQAAFAVPFDKEEMEDLRMIHARVRGNVRCASNVVRTLCS